MKKFGISPSSLALLQADTKECVERFSFQDIRKWNVFGTRLEISINGDQRYEFHSSEAEAISQVMSGCVSFSLRGSQELQRLWEQGYNTIATNPRFSMQVSRHVSIGSACSGDSVVAPFHKCRLYDEPRRQFYNPIYREIKTTLGPIAAASETKRRRLLKLIKIVAHLSRKWPTQLLPNIISALPSNRPEKRSISSPAVRPVTVRLANRKIVTVMAGDDTTVAEVTRLVASNTGIILGIDEFSLQIPSLDRNTEAQWLPPHLSLSAAMTLQLSRQRQLKKRRSIGMTASQLEQLELPTPQQSFIGIGGGGGTDQQNQQQLLLSSQPNLLFCKKFFWGDTSTMDDSSQDPVHFNLLFYQWRNEVTKNAWRTTFPEAVKLAGSLFQISFGDHNPEIHKPGFLRSPEDLHFFMAPEHVSSMPWAKIERTIYKEHSALRGIKEAMAKYRFVMLCRSLKTYGATFFRVKLMKGATNDMLLGFSRAAICLLDPRTKDYVVETPITHLRKWSTNDQTGTICLDFGSYNEGVVVYQCQDPLAVGDFLSDYSDFMLRRNLCRMVRKYSTVPGDAFLMLS